MTKKQAMPYWKHYTSYSDDPDYLELERTARLRYWECYMLAWKADAAGDILNPDTGKPLTVKQIAMLLRDPLEAVTADLAALVTADLLKQSGDTWKIARYSEEQTNQKEYRDAAADRQAKSRENKKDVTSQSRVTVEHSKDKSSHQSSEEKKSHQSSEANAQPDDDNLPSKAEDPIQEHPELEGLLGKWKTHIMRTMSYSTMELINQSLWSGILFDDIHQKIIKTANGCTDPNAVDSYFQTCISELKPPPISKHI